jgi:GH15 family glucan-1,4-alpha-glucosidase
MTLRSAWSHAPVAKQRPHTSPRRGFCGPGATMGRMRPLRDREDLPPIADYALIGDGRTAALSSTRGSIDWMCVPRFDSEPIFGRLIGGDRAGFYALEPEAAREVARKYRDGSSILETTWAVPGSEITLTEGMFLETTGRLLPQCLLVRRLECRGRPARVRIRFDPRRGLHGGELDRIGRHRAVVITRGALAVALQSAPEVPVVPGRDTEIDLEPGRPLTLALSVADRQPLVIVDPDEAFRLLDDTDRWWRGWTSRISYDGPLVESVVRSLITLRLLTYSPSGAPVAAPTTSLPEALGGRRN